jgi:hypothetical protein
MNDTLCILCGGRCFLGCPNGHTVDTAKTKSMLPGKWFIEVNATEGISAEELERCKTNFEEIEKRIPLNNPEIRMTDEERAQLEILGDRRPLGIKYGGGIRALMGVADDMQRLELNTAQRQILAEIGAMRTEWPKIALLPTYLGKGRYGGVAATLSAPATPDNCRPAGKTKNTKFKQSNDWYKKRGRK